MHIETLFLDAGGVLVHPNWHRVSMALREQGVSVAAEVLAAAEPHAKRELDSPEGITAGDDAARGWRYFNLVLQHAGVPLSEATDRGLRQLREYHARENLWETVAADAFPSLVRFREAGLRLVVVSNANGRLGYVLDRLGLSPHFEHALDSHEVGFEKPDPRLFEVALARAEARPETTLHVGDFYHVDVVGARAAGLHAMLLDAAGLQGDRDCTRVASLTALADRLTAGAL